MRVGRKERLHPERLGLSTSAIRAPNVERTLPGRKSGEVWYIVEVSTEDVVIGEFEEE